MFCLTIPGLAQTPPKWTVGDTKITGMLDGYYQWNNNHPASGNTTLRNFEVSANSFALNMVELSATHDPDPIGFRLDLGFGRAWEIFNSFDSTKASDKMRYVQQAYVSIKPENAGGFQFDFGKFFTSAGAELTENHLTWTYGRGWVYTNGPYYHFGARLSKPVTENFTVGFQLVNGWNNLDDNNTGKTMGFTTALTGKKISWLNNYYVGPETTGDNEGWRHFYDTVINLTPTDKFSAYVNYDYGNDRNASADWWVIGMAGHYQADMNNALTFRFEHYEDKDGFITGTARNLRSYTATYEYKWPQGVASRLEYRRDTSDVAFFERGAAGSDPSTHQDTITLGFITVFGQ
jgi:hypothetical protein